MACKKYILTNTTNSNGVFSYQECSNQIWVYDTVIEPNVSLNIWLITGTFATATSSIITIDDLGNFPFLIPPSPTPSNSPTASLTSTPTLTATPTPTNSGTPTATPTLTATPTETIPVTQTSTETPTPTPSPT